STAVAVPAPRRGPLPTVVARLGAHSSPPPPRSGLRRQSRRSNVAKPEAALPVTASQQPDVVVYTAGACAGNPGPGGWGAIIIDGGKERTVSGAEPRTTNQPKELRGANQG